MFAISNILGMQQRSPQCKEAPDHFWLYTLWLRWLAVVANNIWRFYEFRDDTKHYCGHTQCPVLPPSYRHAILISSIIYRRSRYHGHCHRALQPPSLSSRRRHLHRRQGGHLWSLINFEQEPFLVCDYYMIMLMLREKMIWFYGP